MNKNTTENNTAVETTVEQPAAETTTELTGNAKIIEQIRALTAERKAKRDAVVQAVDKLWADYVRWRENEYRPTRDALLKQIDDNKLARAAKREERQKEALEKAEARRLKAEQKVAALREAAEATKAAEVADDAEDQKSAPSPEAPDVIEVTTAKKVTKKIAKK